MTRHRQHPFHSILPPQLESDYEDSIDDDGSSILGSSRSAAATSVTSYDASMRSPSPALSVIPITDSMRERILRQEYGRGLNNYSEVYCLPADDEEWDRLRKQYTLLSDLLGKYAPPVDDIMRDEGPGTEVKRCLDLGCGNGSWIMDVARDFPHCEAVAVDLVPMQSLTMPPNLRSEVDDINLGLEHFYGDFNMVHAWLIASGIKDYGQLIDQISHVLRPGGLIDVMEWDFHVYDSNFNDIKLSTNELGPPWLARFVTFVQSAMRNRGGDIDGPARMETLIRNHPSFENLVHRDHWIPPSPWVKDQPDLISSSLMLREDILEFLKSATPLLLSDGLRPDILELLQNNTRQELIDATFPQWSRLRRVYATKRH